MQTLDLLFKMTNPMNVVVIADRLIAYLRQTRDEYIRSDLVARITQLAERFAPDNQWFLQTMNAVFELGKQIVCIVKCMYVCVRACRRYPLSELSLF